MKTQNRTAKLTGIVLALVIAVGGIFLWQQYRAPSDTAAGFSWQIGGNPPAGGGADGGGAQLAKEFSDDQFKFSFRYPDGMKTSAVEEEEGGRTILAQDEQTKNGFQVFVAPYDETEPLAPERILQDLPDLVMEEVQMSKIDGAHAVVFVTNDPSLGKTREVWFAHGGFLYQVTSRMEFDRVLAEIMATFKFR